VPATRRSRVVASGKSVAKVTDLICCVPPLPFQPRYPAPIRTLERYVRHVPQPPIWSKITSLVERATTREHTAVVDRVRGGRCHSTHLSMSGRGRSALGGSSVRCGLESRPSTPPSHPAARSRLPSPVSHHRDGESSVSRRPRGGRYCSPGCSAAPAFRRPSSPPTPCRGRRRCPRLVAASASDTSGNAASNVADRPPINAGAARPTLVGRPQG